MGRPQFSLTDVLLGKGTWDTEDRRDECGEGRTPEDTAPASKGEKPQDEPTLPTP